MLNYLSPLVNSSLTLQPLVAFNTARLPFDVCKLLPKHALIAHLTFEALAMPNTSARMHAFLVNRFPASTALRSVLGCTRSAFENAGIEHCGVGLQLALTR